jgi:hypothetical protein
MAIILECRSLGLPLRRIKILYIALFALSIALFALSTFLA